VFGKESISFLGNDASYVRRILPGIKVAAKMDKRSRESADIRLYGGGTQFFSYPLTAPKPLWSWSTVVRNLKHPARIPANLLRKIREIGYHTNRAQKLAAIGVGVGPFIENSWWLEQTRELFRRMEYVAVRDIQSYRLCRAWGCKNLSLRSDLCYLPGLWQALEADSCRRGNGGLQRIGVIVRDWHDTHEGDSYAEPLFRAADALRCGGKRVDFISFSATFDVQWNRRLNDRHESLIAWDPERENISAFLEFLSSYDLFITARYHGAVFASLLRKPTVVIEIDNKLALVSELLGDGARLWAYPFDVDQCLEGVAELERNYARSVECLDEVVETQARLATKMVDECELFLNASVGGEAVSAGALALGDNA
jgi:hypothetical protein